MRAKCTGTNIATWIKLKRPVKLGGGIPGLQPMQIKYKKWFRVLEANAFVTDLRKTNGRCISNCRLTSSNQSFTPNPDSSHIKLTHNCATLLFCSNPGGCQQLDPHSICYPRVPDPSPKQTADSSRSQNLLHGLNQANTKSSSTNHDCARHTRAVAQGRSQTATLGSSALRYNKHSHRPHTNANHMQNHEPAK